MRQFKFRAWDSQRKRFMKSHIDATFNVDLDGNITAENYSIYPTFRCGIKQLEITQFTGLLDKSGKEIYEGDLLKNSGKTKIEVCNNNKVVESPYWEISKVVFVEGCFKKIIIAQENSYFGAIPSRPMSIFRPHEYLEVIGNIYENPELLEVNNEF